MEDSRADRFVWQDGDLRPGPCNDCAHKFSHELGCRAFPDRIPLAILTGDQPHDRPVPGQVGDFVLTRREGPAPAGHGDSGR